MTFNKFIVNAGNPIFTGMCPYTEPTELGLKVHAYMSKLVDKVVAGRTLTGKGTVGDWVAKLAEVTEITRPFVLVESDLSASIYKASKTLPVSVIPLQWPDNTGYVVILGILNKGKVYVDIMIRFRSKRAMFNNTLAELVANGSTVGLYIIRIPVADLEAIE